MSLVTSRCVLACWPHPQRAAAASIGTANKYYGLASCVLLLESLIIDNIGSRMDWKRDHVRVLNQHKPCVQEGPCCAVANAVLEVGG